MVSQILLCFMALIDSFAWSLWIYFMYSMVQHYQFPERLMEMMEKQMTEKPLPTTIDLFIDEVMGWWEIRQYYTECIIQLYSWSIRPLIGISLLTVIIVFCIIFEFIIDSGNDDDLWDCLIMIIFVLFVLDFLLLMVKNAVNYNTKQMAHLTVMHHRLVEVQRNELDGHYVTLNEKTSRLYPEIVQSIMEDLKMNCNGIRVFGIKMNVHFMIFLRSCISALLLGIVIALVRHRW